MAYNYEYPYVDPNRYNADWLLSNFNSFIHDLAELKAWRVEHEEEYQELLALYNEVKTDWDNFAAGIFPPSTYDAMKRWWERNAVDLVGSLVKFVFFGLTDTGYFTAYIPENWDEINFDTIVTPDENYGRLCILY